MKKIAFLFPLLCNVLLCGYLNLFAQPQKRINKIKNSLDSLEKALVTAPDKQKIDIYNKIAILFPSIDAEDAVRYAQKALDLAQKQNDLAGIAQSYQSIGKVYEKHEVWEKAAYNYQKAKSFYEKLGDKSKIAFCFNRLGVCLSMQQDYTHAIEACMRSNQLYTELKDKHGMATSFNNLGSIYRRKGEHELALSYLEQALALKKELKDSTILASTIINLAYIYLKKQEYDKALSYGLESYQIAQNQHQTLRAKEASEVLAQIYEAKKEYEKSTYFLKRQIALEDSLFNEEKLRHLFEVQAIYEYEKKEIQINKLKAEKQIQQLWIIIAVVLLALVSTITYFIYRKNIRKEKINQLLKQKNNEIIYQKQLLEEQKRRIEENGKVLLKLVKSKQIQLGDLDRALMQITETTAITLKINRASVWKYDAELDAIFCIDLYEHHKQTHSRGAAIGAANYPIYFEFLKSEKIIQADDAYAHPATKEFENQYLPQNNIRSMLDVPFFVDGKLGGVLCCEQTQELKCWSAEDVLFVKSVCQVITITFKANKRMEAEREIMRQKQALEEANQALLQKNEEILAQRNLLAEKNNEILMQQEQLHEAYEEQQTLNEELRNLTDHLEAIVEERTNNLQLANQELDLLTYRISHDFRGPITTMLGLVELVKMEPTPENIAHLVERVSFTANKMDKMLDKMIMIHTINYKNPTAEEIIDWTYLEEEIYNNLHYLIYPTNTKIHWGIEDELILHSDLEFLTLIFQNLIENAIRFNNSPIPQVWVRADTNHHSVYIYISDNGIGIPKRYQKSIFEMFFRGSELSTGNGLGLYIVEKAVQKLRGEITLQDSILPHESTTFRIRLPLS
ncbi:MAG: tetratricopeptide repeat protein [Microscillaceae bacterium]|nr:tetratricopeptide repeat protein [Microscillaceae bacterium]MDW8460784.1 tetratricopeptide repeat protein [Cytophagales bacterium]